MQVWFEKKILLKKLYQLNKNKIRDNFFFYFTKFKFKTLKDIYIYKFPLNKKEYMYQNKNKCKRLNIFFSLSFSTKELNSMNLYIIPPFLPKQSHQTKKRLPF